jgi:hypothetical protein
MLKVAKTARSVLCQSCVFCGMASLSSGTRQDILKKAWLAGRAGYLSGQSESNLWAICEVWRAEKKSDHGLQTFAARLVTKIWSSRLQFCQSSFTPPPPTNPRVFPLCMLSLFFYCRRSSCVTGMCVLIDDALDGKGPSKER